MKSSLEIARAAKLRPIAEIARDLGLRDAELDLYGTYKAKINPEALARLADKPDGREIVVTAITPTPLGEGKTTTTIGLAQGLNRIGVRAAPTIRQPSLGPVFGLKGGAAGGGFSQVLPMEEINIHFTGDLHAVAAAHNLGAAFLDNHLFRGNALGIDPATVRWPRVIDVNDRALRKVMIGLGDPKDVRETEWHITAASEVMAILALAENVADLRARIGRSIVAENFEGTPVTLDDLKVAGAMTVLLREAMKPNLVQTIEGGPAFIHAGPFANIAHGNSSVAADRIALKLVDAVVTESGFGSDMGFQKFVDIKCRLSGLRPAAAVIVATIRALKMHGGVGHVVAGKPLDPVLTREDPEGVERGCANLLQHIEIVRGYGIPAVVAINRFPTDQPSEYEVVKRIALAAGAHDVVVTDHFVRGGEGAADLARSVWAAASAPPATEDGHGFRFLSRDDATLEERIKRIATRVYGADGVDISGEAQKQLHEFERLGYGHLPVCMAKTALSLSHDPELKGRPTGFRVPIRDARLFAGAGYVTVYCGDMLMMPGLPSHPSGENVDIDENGETVGLF
ncbi:MAG: formate--tetrahydrofolate ligase [Chloroflexota bacterium]